MIINEIKYIIFLFVDQFMKISRKFKCMFRKSVTTRVDSKFMVYKIKQKDSVKKLCL